MWARYLREVYVESPAVPVDAHKFDLLYEPLLPKAEQRVLSGRPVLGLSVGFVNASAAGDALQQVRAHRRGRLVGRTEGDRFSLWPSSKMAFVYRPKRQHSHPSHALVEVAHCYEDADDFYWMYQAVGSGIYFDLGRTSSFTDRFELWRAANVSARDMLFEKYVLAFCRVSAHQRFYCVNPTIQMRQEYRMTRKALGVLALERGLDSVQLTRTQEHGIYKSELINLRPHRRNAQCFEPRRHDRRRGACDTRRPATDATWNADASACPMPADEASFHSGWGGTRPCRCTRRAKCLHCEGMPEEIVYY